jgi:phage tail sheath gpL-like
VHPLDDDVSGVVATGSVVYSGTQSKDGTFYFIIGGVKSQNFTLRTADADLDRVAAMVIAVANIADMPVIPSSGIKTINFTSKWKGRNANDIPIVLVGPTDTGLTFTTTAMHGGEADPAVDTALAQIGDVWESMIINCTHQTVSDNLDEFQTWGEGRWDALVYKPAIVFTGISEPLEADCAALTDDRKDDRVNCLIPCPGSYDMPHVWVADAVGRIARSANSNPAQDFGGIKLSTIYPGTDAEQWTHTERNDAVTKGCSTVEVRDGVVVLSDIVTMYHPTGDPIPAYSYVVDIVKLQQFIYNLSLIFNAPEWQGAPLIPDDQPTVNPTAKQPKAAVAAVNSMIDSLALDAILSDPATAKKTTVAGINESNPKRLDLATTVQLSGNTNIISIDFNFGFYFGGA